MDDPTIPANDRFIQYTATGEATVFPYDFPVFDAGSVAVYRNGARLTFTQDYTVVISPANDGGTVTLLAVPDIGDTITVVGDTPLARTEWYGNGAVVSPSALDGECGKTMMRLQQLNTKILGCLKNTLRETEYANTTLPPTEDRKGKCAAWDGETGSLTYFGDGAMDEIYLKRGNNLSDVTDVDGARDNLKIIDGRELVTNGFPMDYRRVVEFNKAFRLVNVPERTLLSLDLVVTNTGSGIPLITFFSENTIWARSIRAGQNITISLASDGSLVFADTTTRGFPYKFTVAHWSEAGELIIPFSKHRVSEGNNLIVNVRDTAGNDVGCNVRVEVDGTVHIFSNRPFTGTALIYGGIVPFADSRILINPMEEVGDIMVNGEDGAPTRLGIGDLDQVLAVGHNSLPTYKSLGSAAWKNVNIPNGLLQLDSSGLVPANRLPVMTMNYRGTFGSSASTTGGDLPTENVLDGDVHIADGDYASTVAGTTFLTGQWAIYDDVAGWDKIPIQHEVGIFPVGGVMAYAGQSSPVPANFLPCDGYAIAQASFPDLFAAIGTIYNTGGEGYGHFRVPNYNNERRFLQGATVAGYRTAPGLPNITGSFGSVAANAGATPVRGAFYYGTHMNNIKWLHDDAQEVLFDASRCNAIYGAASTVQPMAQNVIYLIRYR